MTITAIAQLIHERALAKQLDHLPKTKALLMKLGKMSDPQNKGS